MFISFVRVFKFAAKDFWRNIWLSLVTTSILALAFVSINVLLVLNLLTENAITTVENRIDVSVYLVPGTSEDVVKNLKSYLSSVPSVKDVQVASADDALAAFRAQHVGNEVISKSLDTIGNNPLGPTLSVKARTPEEYGTIMKALDNPTFAQYIAEKNYDDHKTVINHILALSQDVRTAGLAISVVFLLIAILIVFNSVRVAMYTHREEIAIMKLVGASNAFIRMPFMVEGIYFSLLALLLASAVVLPIVRFLSPLAVQYFGSTNMDLLAYYQANWLVVFGLQLLGGIFLTVIAAGLAVGKYLRR